jgi:hypothetical protein
MNSVPNVVNNRQTLVDYTRSRTDRRRFHMKEFLGAFAKLRIATVSFVMSVRPHQVTPRTQISGWLREPRVPGDSGYPELGIQPELRGVTPGARSSG